MFVSFFYHVFFFLPLLIIWSGLTLSLTRCDLNTIMRGLLSPNDMKEAMDRASTKKVPSVSRRIVIEMLSYRQRTSSICRQSRTSWAA